MHVDLRDSNATEPTWSSDGGVPEAKQRREFTDDEYCVYGLPSVETIASLEMRHFIFVFWRVWVAFILAAIGLGVRKHIQIVPRK